MASGILLCSGQNWVLDAIHTKITSYSGLYVGLMTNSTQPSEDSQLPLASGIKEINETATCSGYSRKLSGTWTHYSGLDPYVQGSSVTFTVASGEWSNVYGYFVSVTASGADVLWTEILPANHCGTFPSGAMINITPKYEQKYENE